MAAVVVIKLEDTESRTDFDVRVATENSHFVLFDGICISPREG